MTETTRPLANGAMSPLQAAMAQFPHAAPPTPPLSPISAADFLALDLKPRELILSPWLPEKGLAMIHAARGVGKTLLALNIAVAIASGGDFLGWRAPRPRRVLLVDGEMPDIALQQRLRAIVAGAEGDYDERLRLLIADREEFGMPDLATPHGQQALLAALGEAEVVILDNLSSLIRSGRDNDADSWTPMQDLLLRLRREGRSVVLLHHSGKGGQQRGSSRKEDVLDSVLALKRPDDYSAAEGARFIVQFEKARGFLGTDATPLEAALGEDGAWTTKPAGDSRRDQVRELKQQGLSVRKIAKETGIAASTIGRWVKETPA